MPVVLTVLKIEGTGFPYTDRPRVNLEGCKCARKIAEPGARKLRNGCNYKIFKLFSLIFFAVKLPYHLGKGFFFRADTHIEES